MARNPLADDEPVAFAPSPPALENVQSVQQAAPDEMPMIEVLV